MQEKAVVHRLFKDLEPSRTPKSGMPGLIPEDFAISAAVRQWAKTNGITQLDARLDDFRDTCLAKGYKYVDWDAAFRGACRKDWARLGAPATPAARVYCCRCGLPTTNGWTSTMEGRMCDQCKYPPR